MSRWRELILTGMLLSGVAALCAQTPEDDALAPLRSGSLWVWVAVPHRPLNLTEKPRIHKDGLVTRLDPKDPNQVLDKSGDDDPETRHDPAWDLLLSRLQTDFPDLNVQFGYVFSEDVGADLTEIGAADDRPDLLLWMAGTVGWPGAGAGVSAWWDAVWVPQTEAAPAPAIRFVPLAALLPNARSADAARAMVEWLADYGLPTVSASCTADDRAAGAFASRVYRRLLAGGSVGEDADAEMDELTRGPREWKTALQQIQTDVVGAQVRGTSAVVALRGSGIDAGVLRVTHALMVLRQDEHGRWRVLQISWNLAPDLVRRGLELLVSAGSEDASLHRNEGEHPLGVLQAGPSDGDSKAPRPELWWDNLGGATLQIVEWQPQRGRGMPSESELYFVPDTGTRLKTSVVARFAEQGSYRWRVWSVGAEGTIVVGTWRTLKIVAR